MCDSESVKILFPVQDRCSEGRYLQGQTQPYVTTGNVETSFICHTQLIILCKCARLYVWSDFSWTNRFTA